MIYELCLEYGTYPLTPKEAYADDRKAIPSFIADNQELLDILESMNTLFHELFLTIECQFHYIGPEFPEKIQTIKKLYQEASDKLLKDYPEKTIHIEPFVLH